MSIEEAATDSLLAPLRLSPYTKFKMALKSKEVQRQYPNLLERFLDFCKFEGLNVEQKAIKFCDFVKSNSQEEVEDLIIRFVLFQKERIYKKEITSGTLRNYVKSIKLFCEMADLPIQWKKITRGLPKGKKYADDRIPTIEEIRKVVDYPDRRIKAIVYTRILLELNNMARFYDDNSSIIMTYH